MANLKNFIGQMGKAVVVALKYVIGVPVGLLIFNPITIIVISIKRRWREWFCDVMDNGGPMSLAAQVMAVATFATLLVASCVVLNPLVVWVIALIAPQWVAEKSTAAITDGFWEMVVGIPLSWQGWIGHLLPWRCRIYFIDEDFSGASSKDRMRITIEESRHFFALSAEEKELVFCRASIEQRREWMERGVELTLPMFRALARVGAAEAIEYANRHNNRFTDEELGCVLSFGDEYVATVIARLTLSDEQLLMLAKSQRNFNNLLAALRRQGCGKGVVSYIISAVKVHVGGDAEEKVRQALGEYRQKGQVSQLREDTEGFKVLCKSGQLCPAAQVKMTVEQYRIFHECGKKLDEMAIRCFLLNGSEEWVKTIFELEEKNGIISQQIADIVYSSPELSNILLKVSADKAAEAEKK